MMAGDDTHNWTTPDELAAVRDAGLHTLHLGKLRYDIDDEAAAKVREFLGSLS